MITTTQALHIDRTEAELTQLRSLNELRQRRQELAKMRKLSKREATKPTAPLAVQVAKTNKKQPPMFAIETLEQLDAIYNSAERLAGLSPLDAIHVSRALLCALLRLSYAKVQGKPRTNPEPNMVPMKLFQKGVITKTVMRRIKKAVEKSSSASNLLECSRVLMVWIAADPDSLVGIDVKATE